MASPQVRDCLNGGLEVMFFVFFVEVVLMEGIAYLLSVVALKESGWKMMGND